MSIVIAAAWQESQDEGKARLKVSNLEFIISRYQWQV
jgi:hypothetical protein